MYKSTVYISDTMSLRQASPVGLYNYTVSYINAAYISFYNVDIHIYVGGGDGRLVGFLFRIQTSGWPNRTTII